MKKINLSIVIALFLFSLTSCTNENNDLNNNNPETFVTKITRKNYNSTTNELLSTLVFKVSNNKILNSSATTTQNSQQANSTFTYVHNTLTQIDNLNDGVLTSTSYFIYDSENRLIENRTESYSASGEVQYINKHVFSRIQDTIYSQWKRKTTTSSEYFTIRSSKIVLDQNKNRTYFEYYDNLNNLFNKVITVYDSNNNILNENYSQLQNNGSYVTTLTNTYTYNPSLNTLAFVVNKTYGRETSMLLYDGSGAINDIFVKSYSPNTLSSFNTTFDSEINFTFTNTTNPNNFSTTSEYKTFISNALFTKFTYDFSFN